MIKWISVLALVFSSTVWADPAPSPLLQPPSMPIINVMTNGSFEAGKATWTNSGGTFTINTSTPLNGKASGAFLPSGSSQTVSSAQFSLKEGLKGVPCSLSILYKTAETTNPYTLQVLDGSSNILGYAQLPSAPSAARRETVPFLCNSSGTMGAQIISSGSAAAILWDDVVLGTYPISQISQATYYGGVVVPTGCTLQNTGSPGHTDFDDGGTCDGATLKGKITSFASTGNGQINLNNLPRGEYEVIFQGQYQTSTATTNSDILLTDGTTDGTQVNLYHSTGSLSIAPATIRGHYTYTSAGDRFFKLQGAGSVTHGLLMNGGEAISVYRYPDQDEIAVRPETLNWDATLKFSGANPSLGTSTNAHQEVTDSNLTATNYGAIQAKVPCSSTNPSTGLVCGAGNPGFGIVINSPKSGRVEVCADFVHIIQPSGTAGALYSSFKIVKTTNSTQTVEQDSQNIQGDGHSGTVNIQQLNPIHVCGQFTLANAGEHTFRLFYQQVASGAAFTASSLSLDSNPGSAPTNATFTVKPLDQKILPPVLMGSVTTPSSGVTVMASVHVSADGATLSRSTGNWVDAGAVYNPATGAYELTWVPGTFNGVPNCFFTSEDNGSTDLPIHITSISSTSVAYISTSNGSAASVPHAVLCIGSK